MDLPRWARSPSAMAQRLCRSRTCPRAHIRSRPSTAAMPTTTRAHLTPLRRQCRRSRPQPPLPAGGLVHYSVRASHSDLITAVYSRDANDNSSTSNAVAETVQKIATTTTFTGWGTRALLGTSIAFTVAVTPAAASGTVNLMRGTTILGTSTLSNGTASFNISTLPAGSTTIYAQYVGNASYLTSSSATLAIVVLLPCTTVLTTTPNPSVYGAPVTLTLTATPAAATGPVQFVNGSITLGTANLVNGQARLTVSNLPVGSNPLTADYSGDATYIGFTSLVVTQAVNKAPTTVALASSKNPDRKSVG